MARSAICAVRLINGVDTNWFDIQTFLFEFVTVKFVLAAAQVLVINDLIR